MLGIRNSHLANIVTKTQMKQTLSNSYCINRYDQQSYYPLTNRSVQYAYKRLNNEKCSFFHCPAAANPAARVCSSLLERRSPDGGPRRRRQPSASSTDRSKFRVERGECSSFGRSADSCSFRWPSSIYCVFLGLRTLRGRDSKSLHRCETPRNHEDSAAHRQWCMQIPS